MSARDIRSSPIPGVLLSAWRFISKLLLLLSINSATTDTPQMGVFFGIGSYSFLTVGIFTLFAEKS